MREFSPNLSRQGNHRADAMDVLVRMIMMQERPTVPVLDQLTAMHRLIEKRWVSGKFLTIDLDKFENGNVRQPEDAYISVCLLGAVSAAREVTFSDDNNQIELVLLLHEVINPDQAYYADEINQIQKNISDFNDALGRTKEDVLAVIDKAKELSQKLANEGTTMKKVMNTRVAARLKKEYGTEHPDPMAL